MRCLALSIAVALSPAVLAPAAEAQDYLNASEILKALPGVWAMEIALPPETRATLQCEQLGMRVSFETGPDKKVVYVSQHVGKEVLPPGESGVSRSKVEVGPNGLSIILQYEGEDRLDKKGNPVRWHLLMPDRDSFYWHREDWLNGGVTAISRRCPDKDLVG
jgi:hypothetical protein